MDPKALPQRELLVDVVGVVGADVVATTIAQHQQQQQQLEFELRLSS